MWGAIASIAAPIVGGLISSSGAKSAANTGADAQNYAADMQYKMWTEANDQFQPFLQAGQYGVANLQALLSGQPVSYGTPTSGTPAATTPTGGRVAPTGTPTGTAPTKPNIQDFQSYNPEADEYRSTLTTNRDYQAAMEKYNQDLSTYNAGSSGNTYGYDDMAVGPQFPANPPGAGAKSQMDTQAQGLYDFNLTQAPDASYTVNPITGELVYGQNASISGEQLSAGGELAPAIPDLPGDLDFKFNPDDEIYRYKQEQLNEQVNRQLAARGLYDSRAGLDVLADSNMALSASEIDKQYARAIQERDFATQTAIDKYKMGANRGQTLYDRLYGQQNDLHNRMYGQATTEDARRFGLSQDKYNTAASQYGRDYGAALDLTKIGAGAAASAGAQSGAVGQSIGSNLANAGAYQAQGQLLASNTLANTITGAGTAIGNYYSSQQAATPVAQNYYDPAILGNNTYGR
jgi:hypothetical protein